MDLFADFPGPTQYPTAEAFNNAVALWLGRVEVPEGRTAQLNQLIQEGNLWYQQQGEPGPVTPGPVTPAPGPRPAPRSTVAVPPWEPRLFPTGWLGGLQFGSGLTNLPPGPTTDWFKSPGQGDFKSEAARFLLGLAENAAPSSWCCAVPGVLRGSWWQERCGDQNCEGGTTTNGGGTQGGLPAGQPMLMGVAPRIVMRPFRICPRGADGKRWRLAKDGRCYPGLTEAQRLYKSRRGKVTKGEWNALQKAKSAAGKFESVEKTLAEISKKTAPNVRTKTKKVCWRCSKNPCACPPS